MELFCGIGGFRVAAESLGIKTIWANDISALACPVYRDRFGEGVLREGDINALLGEIPKHDILTAGFPCQPFSAAGKKEGIRDPRGTLFQSIVDVLEYAQPRYFVLENVKRLLTMENGDHFATVLSALTRLNYFVEWRLLNAKDFSLAQNRERVFIVGTRLDSVDGPAYGCQEMLRLAEPAELSVGSREMLKHVEAWKSFKQHKEKFATWGAAVSGRYLSSCPQSFSAVQPSKSLLDVLETKVAKDYDYTDQTLDRLTKSEAVNRFVNGVEILSNQGGGARMGYTIFGVGGLAPTLTASTSRHYERYKVGRRYRRLTPVEYARLQGFSDNHCASAKAYDQYILYGNAVPPPLAEWVLAQIVGFRRPSSTAHHYGQQELFGA